jgi:phosphate transport system protein
MESQKSQMALRELTTQVLSMGSDVEKAISTVQSLIDRFSKTEFETLFEIERQINERHLKVDEMSVELMAKYSPKASELRRVFAIAKMNSDLERMGDQCRNCAFILQDIHKAHEKVDFSWERIGEMLELVGNMVKASLDGFSILETSKMEEVLQTDNQVDKIKNDILSDCKSRMLQNPKNVDFFLDVIMLAKNIERIGDHATNIAEDVIYACTGTDIRHGGLK